MKCFRSYNLLPSEEYDIYEPIKFFYLVILLPVQVPVLLIFLLLLIFVMILFAGYRIRLPFFLGRCQFLTNKILKKLFYKIEKKLV